jgi:hypothetical protein
MGEGPAGDRRAPGDDPPPGALPGAGRASTGRRSRVDRIPALRRSNNERGTAMASNVSPQWTEGRSAKAAGQPDGANPYEAGSQESADWLSGYTADEAEQNVDRPEPGEG